MIESNERSEELTMIDPHGDVNLVFDDGTLRVSRKALCLSSPVFLAMLDDDSQFSEASDKAVGKDGIRNITLQEDDFVAMETVMKVIHHKNDKVPAKVCFGQLYDIALVCDKYALRECLMPWSLLWFQPYLDDMDQDGFEASLFISIVFRHEKAFTRMTKHLILNTTLSSGILTSPAGIGIEEGISDDIIGQIKEKRASAIEAMLKLFRDLMLRLLYTNAQHVCTQPDKPALCDRSHLGSLLQSFPQFCDPKGDDIINTAITSTVTKVKSLPSHGSEMTFTQLYQSYNTGSHADCNLSRILTPKVELIFESVHGLVLKPQVSK